jgi:ElaB/YqjD/DUF883 family membrane-anchored ribosome-binding protein
VGTEQTPTFPMNHDSKKEADAIRSDIDQTRRRMDDTMDALSNRLQGRHLVEEILGLFRGQSQDGDSRMHKMKERISQSASTAMNTVVDTVKANPLPALMIGAGVAWMIYQTRKQETAGSWSDMLEDEYGTSESHYVSGQYYDRPLEYPSASMSGGHMGEEGTSKFGEMTENLGQKAGAAKDALKQKFSSATGRAGEKMEEWKDRAGEMTDEARQRAEAAYYRTRQRVTSTVEEHPLEMGLGLLAAGVLIGLALPTTEPVNRIVGPTADRLRDRTRERGRELLEKGKRVAHAATTAVKEEAEAQGLTPEQLRERAGNVADRAANETSEEARRQGLTSGTPAGNEGFQSSSDPSVPRPL